MTKPINKHRTDGTFRPGRHGNKRVSDPLQTTPKPPADLPSGCAEIWNYEAEILVQQRTISEKDLSMLADLVRNIHHMRQAEAQLKKGAVIEVETKQGRKPITNPAWRVFQDAQKIVIQLRLQFGQTPLSGQKLDKAPEERKPGPHDDLFGGESPILSLMQKRN